MALRQRTVFRSDPRRSRYREGHRFRPDSKTGPGVVPLNARARRGFDERPRIEISFVLPSPLGPSRPRGDDFSFGTGSGASIEDLRRHDLRQHRAGHTVMKGLPVPAVLPAARTCQRAQAAAPRPTRGPGHRGIKQNPGPDNHPAQLPRDTDRQCRDRRSAETGRRSGVPGPCGKRRAGSAESPMPTASPAARPMQGLTGDFVQFRSRIYRDAELLPDPGDARTPRRSRHGNILTKKVFYTD